MKINILEQNFVQLISAWYLMVLNQLILSLNSALAK